VPSIVVLPWLVFMFSAWDNSRILQRTNLLQIWQRRRLFAAHPGAAFRCNTNIVHMDCVTAVVSQKRSFQIVAGFSCDFYLVHFAESNSHDISDAGCVKHKQKNSKAEDMVKRIMPNPWFEEQAIELEKAKRELLETGLFKDVSDMSGWAPVQVQGTLQNGHWFYFRSKYDSACLSVAEEPWTEPYIAEFEEQVVQLESKLLK
jgi:hypothetical protein